MNQIIMSFDSFRNAMQQCTHMGYMLAVKSYEPEADYIKENDVKKWLQALGIKIKDFTTLVSSEKIRKKRRGVSANSPWYYSKADIIGELSIASIYKSLITPKQ